MLIKAGNRYLPRRAFSQTEHLAGWTELLSPELFKSLVTAGKDIYVARKAEKEPTIPRVTLMDEARRLKEQEAVAIALRARELEEREEKKKTWMWLGIAAIGGLGLLFYLKKK